MTEDQLTTPSPFFADSIHGGSVFARANFGALRLDTMRFAHSGESDVTATLHTSTEATFHDALTSVKAMGYAGRLPFVTVEVSARRGDGAERITSAVRSFITVEEAIALRDQLTTAITEAEVCPDEVVELPADA